MSTLRSENEYRALEAGHNTINALSTRYEDLDKDNLKAAVELGGGETTAFCTHIHSYHLLTQRVH